MSCYVGPDVVENGLVFYYDQNNTQKSWKGAPTTNMVSSSGIDMSTISGYTGTSATKVIELESPSGYALESKLTGTYSGSARHWLGNSSNISPITGNAFYGVCAKKIAGPTTIYPTMFTGTQWIVLLPLDGGVSYLTNEYRRFGAYSSYGTASSGPTMTVSMFSYQTVVVEDIVRWHSPQMEQNTFATPFVVGTRSNTQAILDLTGNNTITANSLTYASDGSFSFNGSSDYIDSGSIAQTGTSTQSLTWACWVKSTATSGDIINMVYPTSGWNMCPIYASGQQFYAKIWSNSSLAAGSTFNLNQYYYLVLVRDNSLNTNLFYINGQLSTSQTGAYSASGFANNHYFGRAGAQATNTYLTGNIPIGQIYNRALSANEIQQNFNATRNRYGI